MVLQTEILKQIDAVLQEYAALRSNSQYGDCSDQSDVKVTEVITMMSECINRFAPAKSQYRESMKSILNRYGVNNGNVVPHIAGILRALRTAYESGYLATIAELIHADVFADFSEMAEYLLSEGYKDPAAVVIGSVLEQHLRELCVKSGIPSTVNGKAKKADLLNADLAGKGAYSKLDQKSITSWLDLRNKAAHGRYTEYTKDQVQNMLDGIRHFLARVPA